MPLFRYLPALLLLGALPSCSSDGPAGRPANAPATQAAPYTAAVRKAAQQYRVHYNTPVSLDSTDYYYQPVSVVAQDNSRTTRLLESSSYYDGASSSSDRIVGTCYNVLFFRRSSAQAQQTLLPHGRFVVTEIDDAKKPDSRWPYLFYTILKADTNADGHQDQEDASALFVSDRSGQQLRQLTPDGTHLEGRLLLPGTSLLLVEVRPDTNHDREYTYADGTYWLRFDLRNLAVAPVRQPSPALANTLHQQMLERQSRNQ
ncbi:hypothetical protein [Hymenobacter yonginensis]|uniref:Lipoprotein n=1 Tax=Hymenobacter yonginensis TaxID=748197 RepID=A0ABY7PQZ2_9BACT|nr:hypothetical protein [Hymenobacter yonginensis]WBO85133.1 hypothetical protein O9Z63_02585 [Hymenobacter yonginensis]